jgi:heme exporter protein B
MEEGTLYGLILSPADRGFLYLGKLLANWLFLMAVDLVVLLAFMIFYNFSFSIQFLWIAVLIVLSALGFSAVGTLLGAMVSTIRTREVLLPILLFPIILPIILPAVNGTQEILLAQEIQSLNRSVELLIAFDVIYLAAGFVLFDYVVAD